MTIEQHEQKAELILDNTQHLYEREQAIFKVYMLTKEDEQFDRRLIDLATRVVSTTNLMERADPFMHGEVFALVKAHIYCYMLREYYDEFIHWNHIVDNKVVATEDRI